MPREGKKPPSSQALALLYLRSKRDWSQRELAEQLGWADEKQVSRYERGGKPLSRKTLDACAAALGYPPEAVDALLFIGTWIEPEEDLDEPPSPEPLSPEERRAIDLSSLTLAWSFADGWRTELIRAVTSLKAEVSRRKAQGLWERLKSATRQERREAVAVLPELQNWALAERVCEASIRAAAHKAEDALDLADLALFIAKRVEGNEGWRSRLEAYCWAHFGNARRVANDLAGADKAFAQAWVLWRAGAKSDPDLLPEWLLFAMESSLRRAQHRFPEALELLERARSSPRANEGLILLQKEHVFDQMGNTHEALMALTAAAPFIEASGDTRLLFALRFKTANHLCYLGRCQEASERLPQIRELAVQQGNELYLVRVVWLEARIAASEERREEAMTGLEQVRQAFTARELPYDAALASLELAALYLEEERTADVRNLARAMGWIFQTQGIAREALAALTLFFEAAQRETATVELTRRVAAELERMKASAPQKECKRGRG
jgi:transcriptional regulator with XRE-family HTH domain